jgi:hypothetical protein
MIDENQKKITFQKTQKELERRKVVIGYSIEVVVKKLNIPRLHLL